METEFSYTLINLDDDLEDYATFYAPRENLKICEIVKEAYEAYDRTINPNTPYRVIIRRVGLYGLEELYDSFFFETDKTGNECYILKRSDKQTIYSK